VFQENTLALESGIFRKSREMFALVLVFIVLVTSGCGSLVRHKVESGDSLYSIGFYYGHDYRDIAEWNNIPAPYVIHKGQWLRVAPPDEKWWAEQHERARKQKHAKKSSAKTQNTAKRRPPVKTVKQVITEDFTDKESRISAWSWPTKGRLLNANKKFSQRNKGIDIRGKQGQLVFATAAGKVVYSGSGLIGYGQLIIIKHNKTYLSAYAHNEKILVKEGDIVERGQKVAHMGRTPDNHVQLHFEIRRNGKPVDPLRFLKR